MIISVPMNAREYKTYMLYEELSGVLATPAQNPRLGSGISPEAVCVSHLLLATSDMYLLSQLVSS
jgi:hypothetical protein